MLTPEDLLLVQAIAEEGSVSAAAYRLGTSQPALSRTLGELERRLGAKLFTRLPRGMEPTDAGKGIANHGRAVTAVTERAQRELQATIGSGTNELLIGLVPETSIVPIVRALLSLQLLERPVRVDARVGPADELVGPLMRGELDLLIGSTWPEDEDLVATPLFEDRSAILARAGHPMLNVSDVAISDLAKLADYPWVLPPATDAITSRIRLMFRDRDIDPPRPAVVSADIPLRIALTGASDFITVLPHDVALIVTNIAPVRIVPIEVPGPYSYVSAIRRRDVPLRPEVDYVLGVLGAEVERSSGRRRANDS